MDLSIVQIRLETYRSYEFGGQAFVAVHAVLGDFAAVENGTTVTDLGLLVSELNGDNEPAAEFLVYWCFWYSRETRSESENACISRGSTQTRAPRVRAGSCSREPSGAVSFKRESPRLWL